MNNKRGGAGAKILLLLILMIASAVGGAYGYRVLDGKLAVRDAMKAVEDVDISDYDTAEQSVIQGFIDDAKKDLGTAKTRKEVYEIIAKFIADVDKVQTINEKKLEEALREAEEAKKKYSDYNNGSNNNSNNNNNSYNSNNSIDSSNDSFSTDSTDNTGNTGSNSSSDVNDSNATDTSDDGGYKSNDLTEPETGTDEDDGKGFLGSLLGGLASGSDDN